MDPQVWGPHGAASLGWAAASDGEAPRTPHKAWRKQALLLAFVATVVTGQRPSSWRSRSEDTKGQFSLGWMLSACEDSGRDGRGGTGRWG